MTVIFVIEVITYLLFSSTGLACNIHLFLNFLEKLQGSSEFNTLCLAKTVPNILVCVTYLLWSTPLSTFNVQFEQIPQFLAVLIGQVNIGATYIARPIIQVLMAVNVWYLINFPLRKLPAYTFKVVIALVTVSAVLVILYTIKRLEPLACGLSYKPQLLIWTNDFTDCFPDISTTAVSIMCIISVCFSIATFMRLCCEKVTGLSGDTLRSRRRKRVRFFIQSVCQDGLYLLDLVSWKKISPLNPEEWFQFVTGKAGLLLLHAFDGFVMFYFHPELYPKWLKKSKASSLVLTRVHSTTAN